MIIPTEEVEQRLVVQYLELKGLKFSSIPNSTYTKSYNQKRKNTEAGLRAGLPDLLIIINNNLVFIEMKRLKGGNVSDNQKEWIKCLNECNGVNAHICKGFDEAKDAIDKYLKISL